MWALSLSTKFSDVFRRKIADSGKLPTDRSGDRATLASDPSTSRRPGWADERARVRPIVHPGAMRQTPGIRLIFRHEQLRSGFRNHSHSLNGYTGYRADPFLDEDIEFALTTAVATAAGAGSR